MMARVCYLICVISCLVCFSGCLNQPISYTTQDIEQQVGIHIPTTMIIDDSHISEDNPSLTQFHTVLDQETLLTFISINNVGETATNFIGQKHDIFSPSLHPWWRPESLYERTLFATTTRTGRLDIVIGKTAEQLASASTSMYLYHIEQL